MRKILSGIRNGSVRGLKIAAIGWLLTFAGPVWAAPFAGIQELNIQADVVDANRPVIELKSDFPVLVQLQAVHADQVKLVLHQAQLAQALLGPADTLNLPPNPYVQQATIQKGQKGANSLVIFLNGAGLGDHLPKLTGDIEELPAKTLAQTNAKRTLAKAKSPKPVVIFPAEALASQPAPSDSALSNMPDNTRIETDNLPEPQDGAPPEPTVQAIAPRILAVTENKPDWPAASTEALLPTLPAEMEVPDDFRPGLQIARQAGSSPIHAVTLGEDGQLVHLTPKNSPIGLVDLAPPQNVYNALSHADPETAAERFMQRAMTAYRENRFGEAEQAMQEAIKLEPENDTLLAALAEVQLKQNRLPEAVLTYKKAMALKPGEYEEEYAAGLIRCGQRKQAIEALKSELSRNPQNARMAYMLGTLYEESGDAQAALSYLQQAAELAPQSADILYNLGLAYEFVGDRLQAEAQYRKAYALSPQSVDIAAALQRVQR